MLRIARVTTARIVTLFRRLPLPVIVPLSSSAKFTRSPEPAMSEAPGKESARPLEVARDRGGGFRSC